MIQFDDDVQQYIEEAANEAILILKSEPFEKYLEWLKDLQYSVDMPTGVAISHLINFKLAGDNDTNT